MRFEVSHISEYNYSSDVFFEPHYFRFKPKTTSHSFVKEYSIAIEPKPSGLSEQIDIENNYNLLAWFDDSHHRLRIIASSLVEANEYNPFNFLVHPQEYLLIPFDYDGLTKQLLKPSLQAEDLSKPLLAYTKKILSESNNQSIDFLLLLTQEIHKAFTVKIRETGNPHKPDLTFRQKEGSCRDIAWMQIHILRQMGIASRFVSGYFYINTENPEFELHAWVEAYLPGAGWIGLDPSHGILTNMYHIPVASSAFYENTMPVSGTVRGSAESELKNELKISLVS